MARAPKSANSNDGMSWIALMPFPAFTPLNWWALATPRNAMLASFNTASMALDAWRAGADSLRAMVRLQQDELLRSLQAPLEASEAEETEAATALDEDEDDTTAALLVRPMVEATRAYSRVGRAFIVAQRDTLRAFAPPVEKPH